MNITSYECQTVIIDLCSGIVNTITYTNEYIQLLVRKQCRKGFNIFNKVMAARPDSIEQYSAYLPRHFGILVIERSTTYLRRTALATVNPNQLYDGQTKEHKKEAK